MPLNANEILLTEFEEHDKFRKKCVICGKIFDYQFSDKHTLIDCLKMLKLNAPSNN